MWVGTRHHHSIQKQKRTLVGKAFWHCGPTVLKALRSDLGGERWGYSQRTARHTFHSLWKRCSECPGCQWEDGWGGGVGVACVWWCTEEQMPAVSLFLLVLWTHTAPQSEHGQERINTGTHTHNLSPRLSRRLLAAQRPQFIFCLTPK